MRVASFSYYQQTIQSIDTHQAQLTKLQSQISSGVRVQVASDDPVAAGQILNADKVLADAAQWQSNVGFLKNNLGLEDSTLSSVTDSLQQIRSLVLQANSSTLTDTDRHAIAVSLQQQLGVIMNAANSQDVNGQYLFGGTQNASPPFTMTNTGVVYNGNSSTLMLPVGPAREIAASDSGDGVFMQLKSGDGQILVGANAANAGQAILHDAHVTNPTQWANGSGGPYTLTFNGGNYQVVDAASTVVASGAYTSGTAIQFNGTSITIEGQPTDGDSFTVGPTSSQDLFATVQNLINLVSASNQTPAQKAQNQTAMYGALQALDGAQTHISNVLGGVGSREQALDVADSQLQARSTQLQSTLSNLQDLDYAAATTQMSKSQLITQAAEQSYVQIQGLSLFNYLR